MQELNLPTKHPYQYMNQQFTLADIEVLCKELGVQYENLGGGDKLRSKALNLQSLMSRNLQLGDLLAAIPHQQSAGYDPEDYIYLLIEDHIDGQQISAICQELALPCNELSLSPQDLTPYDHNNRYRRGKAQILHAYAVQEKRQEELLATMQKLSQTVNIDAFTAPPPPLPHPPPPMHPPMPVISFENFDLRIGEKRLSDGKYPVEVIASSKGSVGPVWHDFPVDDPEFYVLPEKIRRGVAKGPDIKLLGQKIYGMLFPGEIATQFVRCVDNAEEDGKGLRLRLRIDPPELDKWPWEYCHHPKYDYIAQNEMTPFVRFPSESIEVGSLKMPKPIRVLFVTANPNGVDRGLDELDPDKQREVVEEALKPLTEKGQIVFEKLQGAATVRNLRKQLRRGNYHILHYFGHGIVLENGLGALALENEKDGSVHQLDAEQMRVVFRNSGLKVAFLNACQVGGHQGKDPMNSIGRSLMHAGIPVVVAMQYELPQETANLFASSLYESLAEGDPFDQAISMVRSDAFILTDDKVHWGIPILTMRAEDGVF